jgi:tRNA (uracil-5-)-methyltransferase TRM9
MEQAYADHILAAVVQGYNTIARHFAQTRQAPWAEFNELTPLLPEPCHLLDVGCANGRLLPWLRQQCTQLEYTGVDNADELLKIARQNFPDHTFVSASMLQLPFPDEQFNIVACVAALQHLPSVTYREQAMRELWRVTQPGGKLFMLNWDLYQSKFAPDLVQPPAQCDPGDIFIPWKNDHGETVATRYYHAFTPAELTALCTTTGWQVHTCILSSGGHNLVTIAQHA